MGVASTEKITAHVPSGEGHLIGDLLRKYSMRCAASWQVIAYKVDSKVPNFGMSNGSQVSYLEFLKGNLVPKGNKSVGAPKQVEREALCKLCDFSWDGKVFASADFDLHGVSKAVGTKISACVYYGKGTHSVNTNLEILRDYLKSFGEDLQGYFVVPSSHSSVGTFKFSVTPFNEAEEILVIEADTGVTRVALDTVVKSLAGLNTY